MNRIALPLPAHSEIRRAARWLLPSFRHALTLCLGTTLITGACNPAASESAQAEETGEPITEAIEGVEEARLVSLGAGVTEVVYALDMGEHVIAVDASSTYPPETAAAEELPYHRMVPAEAVIALGPSHVLHTAEAGPAAALEQIAAAGVTLVEIPEAHDPEGARARIASIATALDREEAGATLVEALEGGEQALREAEALNITAALIYARGPSTLLVGGSNTAADAMIALAGAENAASELNGFIPLTAEALVAANPDVIIMPEDGIASLGGLDGLAEVPGIAQTSAWEARRVVTMNDQLLLSFGPRYVEAAEELRALLEASAANAGPSNDRTAAETDEEATEL